MADHRHSSLHRRGEKRRADHRSPRKDDRDIVQTLLEVCVAVYRSFNGEPTPRRRLSDTEQRRHKDALCRHLERFCDEMRHQDSRDQCQSPRRQTTDGLADGQHAGPSTARPQRATMPPCSLERVSPAPQVKQLTKKQKQTRRSVARYRLKRRTPGTRQYEQQQAYYNKKIEEHRQAELQQQQQVRTVGGGGPLQGQPIEVDHLFKASLPLSSSSSNSEQGNGSQLMIPEGVIPEFAPQLPVPLKETQQDRASSSGGLVQETYPPDLVAKIFMTLVHLIER